MTASSNAPRHPIHYPALWPCPSLPSLEPSYNTLADYFPGYRNTQLLPPSVWLTRRKRFVAIPLPVPERTAGCGRPSLGAGRPLRLENRQVGSPNYRGETNFVASVRFKGYHFMSCTCCWLTGMTGYIPVLYESLSRVRSMLDADWDKWPIPVLCCTWRPELCQNS